MSCPRLQVTITGAHQLYFLYGDVPKALHGTCELLDDLLHSVGHRRLLLALVWQEPGHDLHEAIAGVTSESR